jgi:hypothetical protein
MAHLHTRKQILETRKQVVDGVALIWRRYVTHDDKVRQSWEIDDSDYRRLQRCMTKTSGA